MWSPHDQRSREIEKVKPRGCAVKACLTRTVNTDTDAATHVHHFQDGSRDHVVWLDTEIGERDGLCIGLGETKADAIVDAIVELQARLDDLKAAL